MLVLWFVYRRCHDKRAVTLTGPSTYVILIVLTKYKRVGQTDGRMEKSDKGSIFTILVPNPKNTVRISNKLMLIFNRQKNLKENDVM